jgi:hypothetical protein
MTWRTLAILGLAASVFQGFAQDRYGDADRKVRRLAPSSFPTLPAELQTDLARRGCTIPQAGTQLVPHNVIKGHFASAEAIDWAVLCSARRVSTIVVYWNGRADDYSLLARAFDIDALQMIGPASLSFGRVLTAADPAVLSQRARQAGISGLPPLDHDGIVDTFADAGSAAYYLLDDRWIRLP